MGGLFWGEWRSPIEEAIGGSHIAETGDKCSTNESLGRAMPDGMAHQVLPKLDLNFHQGCYQPQT